MVGNIFLILNANCCLWSLILLLFIFFFFFFFKKCTIWLYYLSDFGGKSTIGKIGSCCFPLVHTMRINPVMHDYRVVKKMQSGIGRSYRSYIHSKKADLFSLPTDYNRKCFKCPLCYCSGIIPAVVFKSKPIVSHLLCFRRQTINVDVWRWNI